MFCDENAVEIAEEYFRGIKEIVFVSNREFLSAIVREIYDRFQKRRIHPDKNILVIGGLSAPARNIADSFSIFNCGVEVVSDLASFSEENLLIEEGRASEEEKGF